MKHLFVAIQFTFLMILFGCDNKKIEESLKHGAKGGQQIESLSFLPVNQTDAAIDIDDFSSEAEICTYELSRARYDGIHPGEAILIFVTEPFLYKEQVKSDKGGADNAIQVLKMNRIERFATGMYDYSMMTSVFTPMESFEFIYPLKITFSSQDWCGQSFAQVNNSKGFIYNQRSYFQSEGDTVLNLPYALTEDNIFNLARLGKDLLPVGEFDLLPSQSYTRTAHVPFKEYDAEASLGQKDSLLVYNYEIPQLKRSVRIFMDPDHQNRIVKWTETFPTVFDGKLRTSTYKLKGIKKTSYWELNAPTDGNHRDSLNLN
jgi:hypothetical protein